MRRDFSPYFVNVVVFLTLLFALFPANIQAAPDGQVAPCEVVYTIQGDDWLSKLSEKYLGNTLAYPAIVTATNSQHTVDVSFAEIIDPDSIEVGWKLCIPSAADAQAILVDSSQSALATSYLADKAVVTDSLGREVVFAQPPQRIAAIGKAVRMIVDALMMFPEAHQRVIAMEDRTQSVGEYLSVIDPDFEQMVRFDHGVGAEQLITVKPDVVVLKSYLADTVGAPLVEVGLPVVYLDLETPEQFLKDVGTLGELFAAPERAEEIVSFYQERVDRVEQAVQGLADEEKPRVLVLQYSTKGGEVSFTVPPPTWIQTSLVEIAGGIPVWKDDVQGGGWIIVNLEQIAAWNPDQIYVISYNSNPSEVVQQLRENPLWVPLKAVESDQIFAFPKDSELFSWDQPDTRWILGLTWLCTKVHPDRFENVDIQAEIYDFFQYIYGLDESTINEYIIPTLEGDL